eukprot:TRINITY_DN872_c0_g1_i2.p1 TRINITY_DN872_c0_g1~~TRINITY_DN872_c0_g1_i2.p1  ORF type:complete len:1010 (+),score=359.78 TRINITY_DN872_c0_g1_i2:207-3236(+)
MSIDVLNGCDLKDEFDVSEEPGTGNVWGPRPELVYNHALLLELKKHPLALKWPPYLDPAYKNARGFWDPDRWHADQKRSETPEMEEDGERKEKVRERPTSSLGERIKGGEDAIVLSPQRGSFLSGCQAVKEMSLRPGGGTGGDLGSRRVGSGRILRQEIKDDFPPTRGNRVRNERELPPRDGGQRDLGDRDFSKYGFRRDEDDRRGGGGGGGPWDLYDDRRRGGRGGLNNMRRNNRPSENEPEWMNESVTLDDIMELKGFDDGGGERRGSRPNSRQSNRSDRAKQLMAAQQRQQHQPSPPVNKGGEPTAVSEMAKDHQADGFNFDQIMESVNLNSLLGGFGVQEVESNVPAPASQSRFSQFFQAAKPEMPSDQPRGQSRRSSIQEELAGSNILREINGEPSIRIPSPEESNKYFTPISPAAKTGQGSSNILLEMLQKGEPKPPQPGDPMVQQLEDNLKRSLGIESGAAGPPQPHQPPPPHHLLHALQHPQHRQPAPPPPSQQDADLSAFKKLVEQVKGGGMERPPMPGYMPGLVRPTPLGGHPPNATTEQEILEGRAMPAPRMMRPPAIPPQLMQFLDHYPVNPEVLKRPETEQLINCVNNGSFPVENIVGQLANPSLPMRQQELYLTVLKLKTLSFPPALQGLLAGPAGMVAPPRTSPLHEHLSHPPPGVHSRLSPLMFGGGMPPPPPPGAGHLSVSPGPQVQRVPSPQEMTALTQQILQQALIKKKLEEQKENYRKKHEDKDERDSMRGLRGTETAGSPLAFTPTSVMRKNAADRKDSDPRPGVPELKVTTQEENRELQAPQSPGRPILKGKNEERPASLDLGNRRTTRNSVGRSPVLGQSQQPAPQPPPQQPGMLPPGLGLGGPGVHPNLQNPLMFLSNPQLQGLPQSMLGGGAINQFPGGLNGLLAGGARPQPPNMMAGAGGGMHPALRAAAAAGQTSPRSQQPQPAGAVSPAGATPLSRFFPSDVLAAAAAAGGSRPLKMPPLPTGQALTLEEIERHAAAAVKI